MPPKEIWEPIQAIRKVHDKAYSRWMPHINLVYPFIAGEHFPEVLDTLKSALSTISPFKLTFAKIQHFGHKGTCTMWLQPDTEKKREVNEVQNALETVFPYCNELSSKSEDGFTPHLSLGQFPKKDVQQNVENFQANWKSVEFTVSEVYLISRSSFEDPFTVYYRIPFGSSNVEQINPLPSVTQKKESTNTTLFVANIPFKVDDKKLLELFQAHSFQPVSANIAKKPGGGTSKGYGFVEFADPSEAQKAIDKVNGQTIEGRAILVQMSKN